MAQQNSIHSIITFVLFAAVCLLGYMWFNSPRSNLDDVGQKSGLMQTQPEFQGKLEELRMQRYKVQNGVKRLENLKSETVEHLKTKGVNSGEDYLKSTDPDVKYAVVNLKGWVAQIAKINKELKYYDEAILGIEGMLAKIERERIDESIALSPEENKELQKIILDLNERLSIETDILEDEELSDLLDLEMTNTKKD